MAFKQQRLVAATGRDAHVARDTALNLHSGRVGVGAACPAESCRSLRGPRFGQKQSGGTFHFHPRFQVCTVEGIAIILMG
jgi:hypothetical protein